MARRGPFEAVFFGLKEKVPHQPWFQFSPLLCALRFLVTGSKTPVKNNSEIAEPRTSSLVIKAAPKQKVAPWFGCTSKQSRYESDYPGIGMRR